MKKIKLDPNRLQLRKEKIAQLTNEQMGNIFGGQPVTTATVKTCCVAPSVGGINCGDTYQCSSACSVSCGAVCRTADCVVTGDNCSVGP